MVKTKVVNRRTVVILLVTILVGLSAQAQSNTRIEFTPGRETVTLKGTVGASNKDYVLRATEGQRLYITLTSPNPYGRFNIYRTSYDEPLGSAGEMVEGAKDATGWNSGTLEAAGDYHIYVFNPRGENTAFTLEITLLPAGPRVEDFTGDYEIHGKNPRGFTGFKYFVLNTADFKPSRPVPIKPNGFVQAGRKYKMSHIEIVGGSLSFETVDIAGTAYQFKGRLLPYKPNGPLLSGWLSKIVNGKKAAEAQVEFDLIEGVD